MTAENVQTYFQEDIHVKFLYKFIYIRTSNIFREIEQSVFPLWNMYNPKIILLVVCLHFVFVLYFVFVCERVLNLICVFVFVFVFVFCVCMRMCA